MSDPHMPVLEEPSGREQSFVERHSIHPVVFAIGSLVLVFVLYQLVAGTITFLLVGTAVTRDNVTSLRLLTMAGQILFILVPTLFLANLLAPRARGVFPWRMPNLPEIMFAILALLFLQQLFQIYLVFQDMIPLPDFVEKILGPLRKMTEEMFKGLVRADSVGELAFVVFVIAFVPAFVEEFFFRGLIQSSFERSMKPITAALVTGVIFGAYHFNPFSAVPLIGLGCFFGFLRLRSASIVVPMTTHFVNNTLAVLATYFSMDNDMVIGANKQEGLQTSVIIVQFVVYLLLFLAAFLAYLRTSRRTVPDSHDATM